MYKPQVQWILQYMHCSSAFNTHSVPPPVLTLHTQQSLHTTLLLNTLYNGNVAQTTSLTLRCVLTGTGTQRTHAHAHAQTYVVPSMNNHIYSTLFKTQERESDKKKQRNRAKKGITKKKHTNKTTRTCDPKY